ncbi:alpha/beta hydrolase [Pleionea sp. CnH1-48]|uniref:PHA/PHB synthase family protein n=1 Tax=Pleionea sp. CnH1-48 TaxID=2954494 RepID=UPI002097A440|nr:class I poly(R)-hydroxyalkanoic acid synthase [Pleionea sp. CnH1-48]MCO7225714.1 class I poly(R)-hydroxyalkanoic acid synthase [Pleionea sp. CnH1-48]
MMDNLNNQQEFTDFISNLGNQMIKAGEIIQQNANRMWFDMQRQTLMMTELNEAMSALSSHPELLQRYQQRITEGFTGQLPVTVPKKDRRFKDEQWQQAGFAELSQMYLNYCDATTELIEALPGFDEAKKERVLFFLRQWLSAISPSNFLMTNPVAIAETQKTGGANLLQGMTNYLEDLERGQGLHNIRMTDLNAFKPGENLAITEGKVVYQNDLIQLIQYSPKIDKVSERPLLIVPPWINKYYILDLQPKNSLVDWAVKQGQTVFMISWVNPDQSHKNKDFAHYVQEGVIEAINAVCETTGAKKVNTLGYCLGGTLLGTTLAYMKAIKDNRVTSATFFTTLLDFTHPGELGCFLSEEQLEILRQQMDVEGVLDGRALALSYNMLRENDLHWAYHVNNYLLGKEPPAFDLLYWNSDATNLPAAMHHFYLKNMYLENKLKEPAGIEINGVAIDLSKIDIPCYFLSAQKDHIALWESTYLGARLIKGDVTFVLAGSGHVAGVINPADSGKYSYFHNTELKDSSDEWLASAEQQEGSWWPNWMEWLQGNGGRTINAKDPSKGKLPALEDAPGSYVLKTL